jgi:prepilin-type N-terminal cleavage/methylation domain-containing protein
MNAELKKTNCHFDRSNALRCGAEKSIEKTDSSARLRLARNDNHTQDAKGFSLTEVLLAVGILAVGMLFIAGVFPVSIHLTTIASERTIAAVVADEAFAKIKLYGLLPAADANWSATGQSPFEYVASTQPPADYFAYPSTPTDDPTSKRYWWSAVCRRIDLNDVQVTVFVSRKAGMVSQYWVRDPLNLPALKRIARPLPVYISVSAAPSGRPDERLIADLVPADGIDETTFINDGYTIVDDTTGNIYRVLERYIPPNNYVIRLDRSWQGNTLVWVVPPPVGGGRYPCIAVYQKVMRF